VALIDGGGIAVDLPAGWDAEIYQRTANPTAGALQGITEQTNAVMHAANFALPTVRGDFGSGAVEVMTDEDLLIVLFEYNSEDASAALFEHAGIPLPLTMDDFDPSQMQRALQGLSGCQRFFNAAGRAWCLYVVAAQIDLANLVATANEVLGTLDLESL
jgi:hypothetical protein